VLGAGVLAAWQAMHLLGVAVQPQLQQNIGRKAGTDSVDAAVNDSSITHHQAHDH
jgi:hypothetical protein